MSTDSIEGAMKNGIGHLQDGAGGLIGDPELQIKGKVNQASGFIQDLVGQAKTHVADAVETVRDRGTDSMSRVRKSLKDQDITYAEIEKAVAQRPLAAVGVAAGVGLLLGLLLSRSSSDRS